jgi:hypothetical protein
VALVGELALQRRAMLANIPNSAYITHQERLASLVRLTELLEQAGPMEIPNQDLWFSDLHNGRMSTAVLTALLCTHCERLHLGERTVNAAEGARLDAVLDRWARESGAPVPFLRVVDGRIVNTGLQWGVDFAKGDYADRGTVGFCAWERPYRWMGKRGELRLTIGPRDLTLRMAAPISELRRRFGWGSLFVRATLIDAETGLAFPIGTAVLTGDGVRSFSLPTTPMRQALGSGRTARLLLESDRTWTVAATATSDAACPRSVQLFAAGTDGPP